jgi:hypothetical protein
LDYFEDGDYLMDENAFLFWLVLGIIKGFIHQGLGCWAPIHPPKKGVDGSPTPPSAAARLELGAQSAAWEGGIGRETPHPWDGGSREPISKSLVFNLPLNEIWVFWAPIVLIGATSP